MSTDKLHVCGICREFRDKSEVSAHKHIMQEHTISERLQALTQSVEPDEKIIADEPK